MIYSIICFLAFQIADIAFVSICKRIDATVDNMFVSMVNDIRRVTFYGLLSWGIVEFACLMIPKLVEASRV